MGDLCDYTYAELAQGRNTVQLAELDTMLAPPEQKEAARGRANQQAMSQLGVGMITPPRKRK